MTSSLAMRRLDHPEVLAGDARAAAASSIVRSTRIGDIGWVGPKSYSVSDLSKTTVAGPEHSMLGGYSWPVSH